MTRRTLALTTPADRQAPFAEYIEAPDITDQIPGWINNVPVGHWRIWQHFNKDATAGTFLELHADGSVHRITLGPDGNISNTTTILQEL